MQPAATQRPVLGGTSPRTSQACDEQLTSLWAYSASMGAHWGYCRTSDPHGRGWQIAGHKRTSRIIDALAMVRAHGHFVGGLSFHTARTKQYAAGVVAV